jgi:serine/threonine protein kinase
MTRSAGSRIDHYELLEHLADGAQAEVHRAKDLATGQDVVLKFPHPRTLDHPVLAGRWRREMALTERLSHPNVQCRLDAGERHREPYFVLEYACGGSLRSWVGPEPLPISQVVAWGRQLAEALAFLHQRGIVHRDVKPENLLIDDELDLKLADFGASVPMARPRLTWLRLPAVIEGTPEYVSPEQVAGDHGDARSDVYSWGIVMYELLTGRVPFGGGDPASTMSARLTETAVPLACLRPDVPPGLETVIATATRRLPEGRYADGAALLADLDRMDELAPVDRDLGPEPPYAAGARPSEGWALLRFAGAVAMAFVGTAAAIVLLSVALR